MSGSRRSARRRRHRVTRQLARAHRLQPPFQPACYVSAKPGPKCAPENHVWARVTWEYRQEQGDYVSYFSYFSTRAEALSAAPAGMPYSVVNRSLETRAPYPLITDALIHRSRRYTTTPYPDFSNIHRDGPLRKNCGG